MHAFVDCAEGLLRDAGARQLSLVLPPLAYHLHETSAWVNVLLRAGFAVTRHELSYAIDVNRPFGDGIDRGNRKQLRKAEREGLVVADLAPHEYEAAYAVIVENRAKKGRTPSITWEGLQAMASGFPDAVRCFGARHGARLVAAAICLLVNPHVLYVFYWGEVAGAESSSPVTLVARHIHERCMAEGISLLDLGTATVLGVPDPGLVRYKRHLGCRESLKLTLAKDVR
jgi:predicted N-acyltransferase